MAKYLMCAVRDKAVNAFNNPMYFRSKEEAMRSFGDAVRDDKNSQFSQHAKDYSIWHIGYWDDEGEIEITHMTCLLQAVDCLPPS